jgi:hypothetical protein
MNNDDIEDDVADRLRDLTVQREARRRLDAELWTPPPVPTPLFDQMAQALPQTDMVIHGLAPAGILNMNAEAKCGKTSLIVSAVYAMAMDEPFLGKFDTNMETDERIGVLNMELPEEQMLEWFSYTDMSDAAEKRIEVYHAMTHGSAAVDWSNDRAVDWTVKWLQDSGITVLIGDPTAKLYYPNKWGGDPNAAYTAWFQVVEEIKRQAKLRLIWLNTHTGFSPEAADRARGASAMMDNPTVNAVLRHLGPYGKPPGYERWFSARGRGVEVPEFEMVFNPATWLYMATGEGSRAQVGGEKMKGSRALEAWDALATHTSEQRDEGVKGDIEVTAGQLAELVGVRTTDNCSSDHRKGRSLAVDRGWIGERKNGTEKLYKIGKITPPEREPVGK